MSAVNHADAVESKASADLGIKAENGDLKASQKQTARRRAYAKRSCLKCREKKARCELPDLSIPSSMDAVSSEKACHRCKVLSLDCVVWDGDRKRKPKITTATSSAVQITGDTQSQAATKDALKRKRQRKKSPSARSPGSLEQLAAAAAHLSDRGQSAHRHAETSSITDASAPSGSGGRGSMLASVQFFNPAAQEMSANSSAPSPHSRTYAQPDPVSAGHRPRSADETRPGSSSTNGRQVKHMQPPGRTWTSLWRPLSVLIDYAAQQPSFTTYLLSRVNTLLPRDLDVADLISPKTCLHLKPFIRPYVLWHPHLPSLEALYDEHCAKPTASSALLLTSMCLVACRHAMPLTDTLPRKLSALVDQIGTNILLSTPRDLYTVQALELLLAHEPSLVGTQAAGSSQADRGNGLLGESLLAAALTIAKGLDLDQDVDRVASILASSPPSENRRRELGKAMAGASLWISLCIWEGHFSFVNSTVRPIDLTSIVDGARAMIAIDNDGVRIERRDRDPFVLIEHRFPGMDEDSVLRSAGRTGLAYRLMTMARFQSALADLYRILAMAPKLELPGQVPTTPETRAEILACIDTVSKHSEGWEFCKMQDFAVFSTVRPALLLEDWATMESYSLHSLLPCLSICAFCTGELNRGFSAMEMIGHLRRDESFRAQATELGVVRDRDVYKLLSALYLFDRGLGYSRPDLLNRTSRQTGLHNSLLIEATGAPLLLTTAFATDGSKTFLEKTACALAGFSHIPDTINMHLSQMLQTLQRLRECDHNHYTLRAVRGKHSRTPEVPFPSRDRLSPRLKHESGTSADEEVGKSISQIGIVFIEDMVQAMSKWKLGMSLQRQESYLLRPSAVASGASASSTPTSWNAATQIPVSKESDQAHYVMQTNGRGDVPAATQTLDHAAKGTTHLEAQTSNTFAYSTQQPASQQPQQHEGLALAGTTAQGGMFDIPMFDSLFNPNATMDQWANTVPWFDPVMEGGGGFDMSLDMGATMLRPKEALPQHMYRDSYSSHWSATPPAHHSNGQGMPVRNGPNTLRPLLGVSTPLPQAHASYEPTPTYPSSYEMQNHMQQQQQQQHQAYYPPPSTSTPPLSAPHHHQYYGYSQRS